MYNNLSLNLNFTQERERWNRPNTNPVLSFFLCADYLLVLRLDGFHSCCRTNDHWIASLAVCITGCMLLLAFSATACSDPGIVYRSVDRSSFAPVGGVRSGEACSGDHESCSNGNGNGAAVSGHLEAGETLCGESCLDWVGCFVFSCWMFLLCAVFLLGKAPPEITKSPSQSSHSKSLIDSLTVLSVISVAL